MPSKVLKKYQKNERNEYHLSSIGDSKIKNLITEGYYPSNKTETYNKNHSSNYRDTDYVDKQIKQMAEIYSVGKINKMGDYDYSLPITDYKEELEDIKLTMSLVKNVEDYKIVFKELIETRIIVTDDDITSIRLVKPEIRLKGYLDNQYFSFGKGITGLPKDLFEKFKYREVFKDVSKRSLLPVNRNFESGRYDVLLSPEVVGIICHEAIGHLSEYNSIDNKPYLNKFLGKRITIPKVTIIDNGNSKELMGAGDVICDDEGSVSQITKIVDNGVFNSLLYNNNITNDEKLLKGNLRSENHYDTPTTRMTNTYMLPATAKKNKMLESVTKGIYFADSVIDGQSFESGIFRIFFKYGYIIENGIVVSKVRNICIMDHVISFMSNIYEVGNDLELSLGNSRCGKNGNIKVDGGGPHILANTYVGYNVTK